MTNRYSAREAIENALKNAVRYERAGYCARCGAVHTEPVHLDSINLIAEEIYLWLGYGREKQDIRLFGRIVKALEDTPTSGNADEDIGKLATRVLDAFGRG